MADAQIPPQQYAAPGVVPQSEKLTEQYIQHTPTWVVGLRTAQIVFSFVIVIMAGVLIHGHAMNANNFAVACSVFTWLIVTYLLVSEKVASANRLYNIWAVLGIDLFMALLWLACTGANGALRATFNTPVNIIGCFDDGSAVNAHTCTVAKRAALADSTGLAMISAIAGVSAIEWLLFVATLVYHGHTYRLWRQANQTTSADNATVEMKAQGTPMLAPEANIDPAAQPVYPQYSDQQQYHSQYPAQTKLPQPDAAYPQQAAAAAGYTQQTPSPAPPYQQPGTQPYAAYPDPSQPQYHPQQQQAYSPQGTPAPGQPYYPPQQQPPQAQQ